MDRFMAKVVTSSGNKAKKVAVVIMVKGNA